MKIHYLANNLNHKKSISILFIPGIMMPAGIWEKQIEHFSKKYTVVAMDTRSQGESQLTTEGHYAHSMAKDIKSVVDRLDLKQLILVGWSLGVPQVVNYAVHFGSKNLIGLALVDGLVGIDSSVSFYKDIHEYWTQFQVDREKKTRDFLQIIFNKPQPEKFIEKLYTSAMRTPTNTVMTLIQNYLIQDFRHLLPTINTPTWFATVHGPRLEYMQEISKLIPHCHLDIIEDAGHAPFVDQPEKFNSLLENFIHTKAAE